VKMEEKDTMDLEKREDIEKFNSLPWIEKYRPTKLDELISHQEIIQTLTKMIESGRLPHLLFYGPPGTGKTSTILACARLMHGPSYKSQTLELNASDDRKISVVREEIKTFASTQKMFSTGIKLIILDEADAMTKDAQDALRRIMEKYTKNTRFCLICNNVNNIIPAIQSRCTKFRFSALDEDQARERLEYIIKSEEVKIDEGGIKALLKLGKGDMRRSINILQSTFLSFNNDVNEENVYSCTGNPQPQDIDSIYEALMKNNFSEGYEYINNLKKVKGYALLDIIQEITDKIFLTTFPDEAKSELFIKLSDIEYRLSIGSSEKIQVGALISAFILVRDKITKMVEVLVI